MISKKESLKAPQDIYAAMGKRIKSVRNKLNISQKDFAASLAMSSCYLSEIEAGSANPSVGFFYRFSDAYNVSLDYLFFGIGYMFRPIEEEDREDDDIDITCIRELNGLVWLCEHSSFFYYHIIGEAIRFIFQNQVIIEKDIELKRLEREKHIAESTPPNPVTP